MANYETRELSGSLFKNTSKREGKQDADYTGRCKIGGVEFWINAWLNTSKGGDKYMGLKFREVIAQPAEQPPPKQEELPPLDDSIPFALLLPAALSLMGAVSVGANWIA